MGLFRRRVVPVNGNTRTESRLVHAPDPYGLQAASLALITLPMSPASRGTHYGGTSYTGLAGYGVLRASGAGPDTIQKWTTPILPIAQVADPRLGFGAMTSGQPGLPNTGDQSGFGLLNLGKPGMG